MPESASTEQYLNKSLDKALLVLDLFDHDQEALTVTEVARRMNTQPGTIYPTLCTLVKHKYLDKGPSKKYRLGLRFLEKSNYLLSRMDLLEAAKPVLKELAERLECNSHIAILYDQEVMYLHREEGYPSVTLTGIIGRKAPAHCTALGKVLLSGLEESDLDCYLETRDLTRKTQNTITNPDQLREELALVREQGYAIDDEEFTEGNFCIACPVRNFEGDIVASESISMQKSRRTRCDREYLVENVCDASRKTSEKIGFHGKPETGTT